VFLLDRNALCGILSNKYSVLYILVTVHLGIILKKKKIANLTHKSFYIQDYS